MMHGPKDIKLLLKLASKDQLSPVKIHYSRTYWAIEEEGATYPSERRNSFTPWRQNRIAEEQTS